MYNEAKIRVLRFSVQTDFALKQSYQLKKNGEVRKMTPRGNRCLLKFFQNYIRL